MAEHVLSFHWYDVEPELAHRAAPTGCCISIRSRLCNTTCLATEGLKPFLVADCIDKFFLGMREVRLCQIRIEYERQTYL